MEVDGVLWAIKVGKLAPEAFEGVSDCFLVGSECVFSAPFYYGTGFFVCETNNVSGAGISLSETSCSGSRGPLDTESPAG